MSADGVVCNQNSGFPIRVYNANNEKTKLFPNTRVGWLTPYENTYINKKDKKDSDTKNERYMFSMQEELSKKQMLDKIKIGKFDEKITDEITDILWNYRDVFSENKRDLGCADIQHEIITRDHPPIALKQRRIPVALEEEVDQQVQKMLTDGIIRESTSPWSFPLVVVRKPNGDLRLCVDYRKLNEITVRPIYPISDTRTIFDSLEGNRYFSCLDLSSGYHQVPMKESDKSKTAFSTRRGQYEFNRLPFGLCGAPSTFQRIMNVILKQQVWRSCVVYLDDVLIFGRTIEEHNKRLKEVLEQFRKSSLKLSPSKCSFLKTEVQYLGHKISEKGISTDPKKIQSIIEWPKPNCVNEVHSFVGLCSYYRSYIQNFTNIVEPLQKIIASKKFLWEKEQDESFIRLKIALTNAPVLALPISGGKFILDTDASNSAIGAVLSQIQNGVEKVIAYASNKLTKTQKSYCITRKELLAAYHYIKQFKHYLTGKTFTLRTDHKALLWLLNWKKPNTSQYCLWKADLECFSFDIEHRKGSRHINADALSRGLICEQCELTHSEPKKRRNVKLIEEQFLKETEVEEDMVLVTRANEEMSMIESQLNDQEVNIVKNWMKEGMIEINEPKDYEKMSKFGQSLWKARRSLRIRGDVLYQVDKAEQIYSLVVVPELFEEILKQFHDHLGHIGSRKSMDLIRTRYYWPQMEKTVNEYIKRCLLCSLHKEKNGKDYAFPQNISCDRPFHRICIDICGPLETTRKGNRYVLGIVDHFSKFLVLVPLRSADAKTIATALWKEWITKFGCPDILFSDSGKVFESELVKEICKECKIKKMFSAPYHQQANGLIERCFRTIKPMLVISAEQEGRSWDDVIPTVELAMRASVQASTGYSPFEIIFGTQIKLPWENKSQNKYECENIRKYLEMKENYRNLLFKKVQENTNAKLQANDKYKKKYQPKEIQIGDEVYVKNELRTGFGVPKYNGPFLVKRKKGKHGYVLERKTTGKIIWRHYNDIKKVTIFEQQKEKKTVRTDTSIWSEKRNAMKLKDNGRHKKEKRNNDQQKRNNDQQKSFENRDRRYPIRNRIPAQRFGFNDLILA